MEAENAPGERRVAPNPWATLSVHVVASPASHGALEGGGLSVRSFAKSKISVVRHKASLRTCARHAFFYMLNTETKRPRTVSSHVLAARQPRP